MLDASISTAAAADQLLLLLLICCARITDVSIGTLRIIFVSKGLKYWAAILGFVESLIWILAITKVMQNLGDWQTYVAFACGFSAGNFFGILLEERIALGYLVIRIIVRHDATELTQQLRTSGYGVTSVDGQGESGTVKVLFTMINRRQLKKVVALIKKYNPKAFYSIEDVRFASGAVFFPPAPPLKKQALGAKVRK